MSDLTKEEAKWLKDFQKLMDKCPSKRLGAFTTGDAELRIYDKRLFEEYRCKHPRDHRDDVVIHGEIGSRLYSIEMPFQVDGVCG